MMQEGTETAPTGDPHHLHFQDLHSAGSVVDIRHVVSSCLPPAITSARTEEDEEDNARDHPAAEYPQRRDTYNHHHPHGDHQDGTVDGDLSFLYLHYDRMCDSATAQGRTQEHSCPHNVLPLMLPSLLGRQHDEQLHPAAIKEEPHDDHARLLQSIYSPSLGNGTTSPPISAYKDHHHHCCPDNSDSEDSFDDEIYRLFGCSTDEQKRGTRRTKYATVLSLKPRTTATTTQEESLLVDSFAPSVTPDNVATLATTRNLKLVSPSPQPVFESSQLDSSSLARCVIPFGGTCTGTTNKGSSLPLYPMQWWSCQDNREDDFTPPSCRASTNHHDGLSKMNMIPFPPPESQPAIPAQGSTLYSTMSSSNNQETTSTAMLPQGVPMSPPPLLYSAPPGTILHATTGTTTATTTPRPLPFLIDKSLSSSLHDYHTPIKMHLVSPLLPSRQIRCSSSSGTISAFAARNGARNPPLEQDQTRKRLLFGDDEMMSDLCPTPSSLPFLQPMKKRPRALHNDENDHDQYSYHDPSSSSLQTMITVGQTSTNLVVGGPSSWQSQPRPTSTLDGFYSFTPGDHDGAVATATSLHEPPDDQCPVIIGKQEEKAGATGRVKSSSSSSSSSPMSCEKRLHFWAFQSRTWTARFREAQAYRLKNGHCRIPENFPENIALGRWAKRQRSQYKIHQRTCLSGGNNNMMRYQEQHDGGSTSSTTMNMVKKVFVGENCQEEEVVVREEECRVTTTFKASWLLPQPSGSTPTRPAGSSTSDGGYYEEIDAEGQRHHDDGPAREERSSSSCNPLTEERIRLLESIGFVWDLQACDWVHRYDQLLEFKLLHGHADVPQKYPQNQPLSTWVRTQRRSHAKGGCMPSDRIEQLDRIGFDWENPSAKKKKM